MSVSGFYTWLIFTLLFCSSILWGLSLHAELPPFIDLGIITTAVFTIMAVILFYFAKGSVLNPNRTKFIALTISNMMMKMFVSIVLVLMYYKLKTPNHPLFIIPFISIYFVFTIFETYFLLSIANYKKES